MEILAYSHLTLAQEPEVLFDSSALPADRLRTLTALAGAVLMGSAALAPTPASAQVATVLSRNDTGAEVTRVQNRLAELGYFNANATGFFGSITEDAVTRFQRDQGLQADGVVGSQTLAALFNSSSSSSAPAQTTPAASSSSSSSSSSTASAAIPSATANPATAALQRDLASLGYDPGTVDGIFGPRTVQAVESFQQNSGLTVNGVPSIETLQALENALDNGITAQNAVNTGTGGSTETVEATATPRVVNQPTAAIPASTQVQATANQDTLQLRRGTQTGQVIVQNDPSRTPVEALNTVPVTSSNRITSIPPLNAGVQQVAFVPASGSSSLGIGGTTAAAYALPYVVAVPERGSTIEEVQELVPGAYVAPSNRGAYVYAGSFANRQQAEALSQQLRSEGLDARVAFRP